MTDDRQSSPDFPGELVGAAERLSIPVLAIEKDYWVTRALRGMANSHPGGFIFKGGTSLTKGWGIGQRFSEDIDILVTDRPNPDSVNGRETILKAICTTAAEACGTTAERLMSGKGEHRTARVDYDAHFAGDGSILDHIRLELGYAGGPAPIEVRSLTPLVADALADEGVDVSAHPDLRSFDVTCLHPGRTLIEKIMILNSKVGFATTREELVAGRMARHFYDVYELLGDERVLDLLGDRRTFDAIVGEHLRVSEAFGGSAPRPEGGFSEAYAFNASGVHLETLLGAYEEGIAPLYYGLEAELPTWQDMVDRVHATSELL